MQHKVVANQYASVMAIVQADFSQNKLLFVCLVGQALQQTLVIRIWKTQWHAERWKICSNLLFRSRPSPLPRKLTKDHQVAGAFGHPQMVLQHQCVFSAIFRSTGGDDQGAHSIGCAMPEPRGIRDLQFAFIPAGLRRGITNTIITFGG